MFSIKNMVALEVSAGNLVFSIAFLFLAVLAAGFLVYFAIRFFKVYNSDSPVAIPVTIQDDAVVTEKNVVTRKAVTALEKTIVNVANTVSRNTDKIQIGLSSIIGTRKYQQDAVIACSKAYLRKNNFKKGMVVLCDGMGGLNGGEIASSLTTKRIYEDFLKSNPTNIPRFLKEEVRKVDNLVYELKDENNRPMGAGSTMLCIVIENGNLFWVSVGDSRIYLIRDNEIAQITEDHNYYSILKKKAESGLISFEEAANDPKAEALISFIGIGKESPIDNNDQPFPLKDGDIILLCSDGLYKTLPDEEILATILKNSDNVDAAADMLTKVVIGKQRKGQDNTTVAVVKYVM